MSEHTSPTELRAALHAFGLARDRLLIGLAREAGLAQIDLHALEHLEASGGELRPRQLEGRLGLTSGAVTALIDRLERTGWVERVPNPADRRSVLVRLSERATAEGAAHLAGYHAAVERTLRGLSPAERTAMAKALDRLARAANEGAEPLWPQPSTTPRKGSDPV